MAWKEARNSATQLSEYLEECAKAIESLERDNIVPVFLSLKNLFSNIISAKGGTITGQPSLEQYFDALNGATSCFSEEQATAFKNHIVAAKEIIAQDENVTFTTEQKTILLQTANGINEQCKTKFFRGGNSWGNNGGNRRGGWRGGNKNDNKCWDFARGRCRKGAQCKWYHDETCWDFKRGNCRKGAECKWKHVDDSVCWDFQKGKCQKGAECKWKHIMPNQANTVTQPASFLSTSI